MSDITAAPAPTCPVHPYGYHSRSRVTRRNSEVLSEPSLVGLPARCLELEHELEESGRIDGFVRQLWVTEREGRVGASLLLIVGAILGAVFGSLAVAQDLVTGWATAGWLGGLVVVGVSVEAVLVRTHRTRLRRVYEWREYVGFQV